MLSALEELSKFRSEMGTFRTWMEKAYKVLEDKERQLANLNKLQGNTDDIKSFVSDVMTHGADLKFLTMSGQKFVDLSKVRKKEPEILFSFIALLSPSWILLTLTFFRTRAQGCACASLHNLSVQVQ